MEYKRILSIQDLSCLGQCSTTVAMPVLSAWGHETCVLPTALLSTHTGGFGTPEVVHLDDFLFRTLDHWERRGITFDAVLIGYLGSLKAVDAARQAVSRLLAPGGVCVLDPVMGDRGRLYSGFDLEYVEAIRELCRIAHIMLPNITEAALLAGTPYEEAEGAAYARKLLDKLDHPQVLLTGVGPTADQTGFLLKQGGNVRSYHHRRIGAGCHGTGDLFAACLTGAWMRGNEPMEAGRMAADFVCACVENTQGDPDHWYGVKFEPLLAKWIQERKGQ